MMLHLKKYHPRTSPSFPWQPKLLLGLCCLLMAGCQKPGQEDTAAIAQEYQKVSTAEITQLMGFYHYRLSLDHAMLMGLEDVARWIFQQSENPDHPIPNLMNRSIPNPCGW